MASLSRPSRLVALGVLAAAALAAQAKDDKPHWAYHGRHGAQAWGNLEPGFAACKRGKLQSPIDIRDAHAKKSGTPAIRFGYLAARGRIFNNGHTIQVNMPAAGGAVLGDSDYQLLQFHFHAPGEERINGRRHPMSLHMVHRNARGQLAVIALLLKEGKENPALKPVFDRLPAKPGDRRSLTGFNPADMLPADHGYYRFKGSLTTPPCSEEVSWHVLKQPVEISKAQLRAFRKLYPMNARPVQPLNGRTVETN